MRILKNEHNKEKAIFRSPVNRFQTEGRYPDYINKLYKETTKQLSTEYIKRIKTIAKYLKEKLS